MSILEELLLEMGLGEPSVRAGVAVGLATTVTYALKPSYFFDKDGDPRSCKLFTGDYDDPEASLLPWFVVPVVAGILGFAI